MKDKYEEYKVMFEREVLPLFPNARLKSREEFMWNEYCDSVMMYLSQEWIDTHLSSLIYEGVSDEELDSEELSEAELKAFELQDSVDEIVREFYENGDCVANCAGEVYHFLKSHNLIKDE